MLDSNETVSPPLLAAEDKGNLSEIRGKLEQAIDEVEDALEREKKV